MNKLGWRACVLAGPIPYFSSVLGMKFTAITSAVAARSSKIARPRALRRFEVTFFVPAINLTGGAEVAHLPIAEGAADAGLFDFNYLGGMVDHGMAMALPVTWCDRSKMRKPASAACPSV